MDHKLERLSIDLAEYIRIARDKKGIKYKWLADTLGISQSNLSHKLAKNRLYASEILLLASVLDLDLNKIVEDIKVGDTEECILKD